ncbi:uncharacterized protein LY89DRAFT_735336 [Mollisia scopiformis]|uniref:Uncharacterized protein n=1 Tax=Mollisia scopiformis TaxID=149040 RepID=A0A194X4V5_MOLSC|nr:uncharacterized protein LY89DRAFT_735336 [Mollisia scopiformis]KUJ15205.1 hypothetical protein LY89DRAFT_735336 [Mollisia scopiformis]
MDNNGTVTTTSNKETKLDEESQDIPWSSLQEQYDYDPSPAVLGQRPNKFERLDRRPQEGYHPVSFSEPSELEKHDMTELEPGDIARWVNAPRSITSTALSIKEQQADKRQSGHLERSRTQLSTAVAFPPHESEFIDLLEKHLKAQAKTILCRREKVDSGAVAFLKEFKDDTRQAAVHINGHFRNRTCSLFLMGNVLRNLHPGLPLYLPSLCDPDTAKKEKYPSRQAFDRGDETGKHQRRVYLIRAVRKELIEPVTLLLSYLAPSTSTSTQPLLVRYRYTVFHYVGSDRSAKGGMLLRAVEAAAPEYCRGNRTELHKELSNLNTTFKVYILADWDSIRSELSKESDFDEILIAEAICQTILRTGCLFRQSGNRGEKMTGFFKHLQLEAGDDEPLPNNNGLNVQSALESLRYPDRRNTSFST